MPHEYLAHELRRYLGHDHNIVTGSTATPYRDQISGNTFATEQEALLSIHNSLKVAGREYGVSLDEAQSFYQAAQ